ncbi:hypothetical protein CRUP_017692 [Coryphaenoides rupestris]|nr:hypothetical protein CRUP_017692 [Coryphaenoides rupestris]
MIATTPEQVRDFMAGTLLCVQEERLCVERSLGDTVQASLDLLQEKDLITVSEGPEGDTRTLEVTKLGRATYKSSVDLSQCDVLYRDLSKSLESLMLHSHLHLLYLVTPYDLVAQCKPDWMTFYRQTQWFSSPFHPAVRLRAEDVRGGRGARELCGPEGCRPDGEEGERWGGVSFWRQLQSLP